MIPPYGHCHEIGRQVNVIDNVDRLFKQPGLSWSVARAKQCLEWVYFSVVNKLVLANHGNFGLGEAGVEKLQNAFKTRKESPPLRSACCKK